MLAVRAVVRQNMKIGITGSKGFVAGHVIEALKNNKRKADIYYFDLPHDNILDPAALKRFAKGKNIIIHAAAVNRGSDTEVIAGSVVGAYNLASAAETTKRKPKIIFLSSVQAANDSVYGLSKRLAEKILEDFSKINNTPVTVIRLPNIFGEGARTFYNTVVATFCYQTSRNKPLTVHKGGKNKKIKLLYVKDAVRIVFNEIFKKGGNKFTLRKINTKNEITVGDLAKLIQSFKFLKNEKRLKSKFYKDLYKTYLSYANGSR